MLLLAKQLYLELNFIPSFLFNILIYKARVPVGRNILELPAGMLDDDKGDIVGTAVREVHFCLTLSSCTDSTCFICISITNGLFTCMTNVFICLF